MELVLAGSRVELVLGIVEQVLEPVLEPVLELVLEPVLEPVLGGGGTPSHLFSPDLNVNSITIGYRLLGCLCLH